MTPDDAARVARANFLAAQCSICSNSTIASPIDPLWVAHHEDARRAMEAAKKWEHAAIANGVEAATEQKRAERAEAYQQELRRLLHKRTKERDELEKVVSAQAAIAQTEQQRAEKAEAENKLRHEDILYLIKERDAARAAEQAVAKQARVNRQREMEAESDLARTREEHGALTAEANGARDAYERTAALMRALQERWDALWKIAVELWAPHDPLEPGWSLEQAVEAEALRQSLAPAVLAGSGQGGSPVSQPSNGSINAVRGSREEAHDSGGPAPAKPASGNHDHTQCEEAGERCQHGHMNHWCCCLCGTPEPPPPPVECRFEVYFDGSVRCSTHRCVIYEMRKGGYLVCPACPAKGA